MTIEVGGGTQVGSGITLAGGDPTLPAVPAYTPAFVSFISTPPSYTTPQTGYTVTSGTTNYSVVLTGQGSGPAYDSATVATPPANGTVSISGTSINYTPTSSYAGADSFALTLSAGGATQTVTVNLTVLAAAPNYTATQSFIVNRNGSTGITLTGNSGVGTTYTSVAVFTPPSRGTVSITKPASIIYIVYNPAANYSGTDSFVLTLTNSGGSQNVTVNMTVAAQLTAVNSVTSVSLNSGVPLGSPIYPMTTVRGGQAPYYYFFTSNLAPTSNILGLSTNGLTGAISGTPTMITTANVRVEVADSGGGTDPLPTGYVNITSVPRITATANTAIPTLAVGGTLTAFQFLTVSGGVPPYTFSANSGSTIPPGLWWTQGFSNGILSGTVTDSAGTYNATFSVSDSASVPATATTTSTINFIVNSRLTATAGTYFATAMPLVAGSAFTYLPWASVTGGVPPYKYSVSGSIPATLGATLDANTGVLSGTPITGGVNNASILIKVQDSLGTYATWTRPSDGLIFTSINFVFTIAPEITATASNTAQFLTPGVTIAAFQPLTVTANTGAAPYTYSVTPALPAGLTLNATTGQVTGTPTVAVAAANYVFSVRDTLNATALTTSTVSITVKTPYTINYLVVGGGGSGGTGTVPPAGSAGGGGGGGGMLASTLTVSSGTNYTIRIGLGGKRCGLITDRSSSISGPGITTVTACGGGRGAGSFQNSSGGSGGGGGAYYCAGDPGDAGISGQGFPGGLGGYSAAPRRGSAGGGGGAGGSGGPGAPKILAGGGGIGKLWPFTAQYYGGGGGGGAFGGSSINSSPAGVPGGGGGGSSTGPGTDGNPGQGGGGGGGSAGGLGGLGGSGVVILAVPTPQYPGSAPGATVTTPTAAPGMTVITFTSPGTYTA